MDMNLENFKAHINSWFTKTTADDAERVPQSFLDDLVN